MKRLTSSLFPLLLAALFSCTPASEQENPAGEDIFPAEDGSIILLARMAQENIVPVDTEENPGIPAGRLSWKAGDRITIACDGKLYIYETKTPGRESIFRPVDKDNALQELKAGTRLAAWYNASSVQPSGEGSFTIEPNQVEGEASNRVPLFSEFTLQVNSDGMVEMVFQPMASILEFRLRAPVDYLVDRVVFTPASGAQGETSSLSLTLPGPQNIVGGRSVCFVTGKMKMDTTGAQLDLYNGTELVFSQILWKDVKVDLTASPLHCWCPVVVDDVETIIRTPHPRMFFTAKDLPAMRNRIQQNAYLNNHEYRWMKERVDALLDQPITFPNPLELDGSNNTNHEWGFRLHEAALLWLLTQETKYLDFSKKLMKALTEYYQLRNDNNLNIDWYIFSQASAACAWDWLYNDLTPAERKELGPAFYQALCGIAWFPGQRSGRYRENVSDYTSGCYGTPMLPWYISLAFSGDGIDDAACDSMFESGYALNEQMAAYRRDMIGNAPGAATPCVVYSLGYYPVADFNFARLVKSATGLDISQQVQYVFHYLDYIDWVRLPGNGSYGFGDEHHTTATLPIKEINYSMREIASLFSDYPGITSKASRLLEEFTVSFMAAPFPVIPFLHLQDLPDPESAAPSQPGVIFCENMGEVIMRSGTLEGDTYCLFSTGGKTENHTHYDKNHFTIYKNGFRAVDSGTRPEPGLHLPYYYARTVAHNCVTVRMPGEVMPEHWGSAAPGEDASLPVPNDGGQNSILGCVLKNLEETDSYVSLSSDATACYNSAKVSLVEREFIWFKPDLFVVFDRVESKNKDYPKKWLLHTVSEPVMNGASEFSETSSGGKMICRTLWPSDAVLEKIGGPGYEYWSDGRNWPLPDNLPVSLFPEGPNSPNFGHWRVEVNPASAALQDYFLHMIIVGDEFLTSLPETQTWKEGGNLHLRFTYRGNPFELSFDTGAASGVVIKDVQSGFNNYPFIQL